MRVALSSLMLLLASSAGALQLDVDRARLCADAERIAVVEPTSASHHWAPGDQGAIERHVELYVHRVLRGTLPETPRLVLPGGRIGDLRHEVEDVPELSLDQPYLLFLVGSDDGLVVLGGELGAVPIKLVPGDLGEALDVALEGCLVP